MSIYLIEFPDVQLFDIFFGGKTYIPSGKHTKSNGKSSFLMGKSTINDHVQ
jgi:hypothetical protein